MENCCCFGCAIIGFLVMLYTGVTVLIASGKENKMRALQTTSLSQLLGKARELMNKPQCLELKGKASCDSPIFTPFTGTKTTWYEFKVTQYWTTPSGDDDTDHNKVVHKSRQTCPFILTDGTGSIPVSIDANLNCDFDSEYEEEFTSVQFVKNEPITYQNMPHSATDISYEYLENYLPLHKNLYFIGNVQFDGERYILKPGGEHSILSDKSEKDIIKHVRKQRASHIRWLFAATVVFALGFVGWYGQPEGLANVLRGIMEFTFEVLSEMD